jgi:hypothetical protein
VGELNEASAGQDFERIYFLAHKLKSSIGLLQSMTLYSMLCGIEEHAKEGKDTTAMMQAIVSMYNELEMILKALYPLNTNDENPGSRR